VFDSRHDSTARLAQSITAADSGASRPAFRNDVAHPFRDDLAQRSEMMSPGLPG
jgi:hypothetical protein